ncbi:unnamed protein product [Blepharisma stoltei]|uniref:Uncharacterized protein n=1 Tax=Blepharisma stoltei TaxID=1481888 RepID=A0AAU9IPH2_9CILI|nr:unnamed protein product [Blepharisma stoltei]
MGCGVPKRKATSKLNKADELDTSLQYFNSNPRIPSIYIKSPMADQKSGFSCWDNHFEYNIKGTSYTIIISRVKYNDCSSQFD